MDNTEMFVIKDGVLVSYNGRDEHVVVPDGVVEIAAQVFKDAYYLKRITLPNGLKEIGTYAFASCKSLKTVELPEGLKKFGGCCFGDCSSLESIVIPSGAGIGWAAFNGCKSLKSVTLPDTLEIIGARTFRGCRSLEDITLPAGLMRIWDEAFKDCSALKSISIPDGIDEIAEGAFVRRTSLKSVVLPKNLKKISAKAFYACSSLESLQLPSDTKKIGPSAFAGCTSLTSVTFNSTLQEIGSKAFEKCASLTGVTLPSGVKKVGDKAFDKCPPVGGYAPAKAPVLPDATPGNPVFAFDVKANSCKATLMSIHKSDTQLVFPSEHDGRAVTDIVLDRKCRNKSFWGRTWERIVVPGTVKNYGGIFNSLTIKNLIFEEGVKVITRIDNAEITDLYLPVSVEEIEKCAFMCATKIQHIHIPAGSNLQYIGSGAFSFCQLKDMPIPDYVLADCVVEGDAVYIPSEDNPHFILLKVPAEGPINENTQIVYPHRANEDAVTKRTCYADPPPKWIVPVTLRQLLELEKKHGKCLYINEGWELRGEELFNPKGEKAGDFDSTVFIRYFYYHGGHFWHQYFLGVAPPAPLFGYRGWKYLSEKKGHDYIDRADLILCTVNENGEIEYEFDYDIDVFGELDVFSSPQAFNLIHLVDSEAG